MNIREIRQLASQFRSAADNAFEQDAFGQEYPFDRFPEECCDDMCDLFGQLLFERNIAVFKVRGIYRYDNWEHKYPHVWLQLEDETIIDLTGDQYCDDPLMLNYSNPCFVGRASEFHALFPEEDLQTTPFYGINNYVDENARQRLWKLYNTILTFMIED